MHSSPDVNPQKYWIYAILILGLLECVLLTLIGLEPAPVNATGVAHPSIPDMVVGADSTRITSISTYAFWFQVFVLAQAHCLAALGVRKERRTSTFLALLGGCYLLAVFVWWQMYTGHQAFMSTGETDYFLGFPIATAWQTYGVWFSGFGLISLYSFGFRHYVWSDEDEEKFSALVAANPTLENSPLENQEEA